MNTCWAAEKMQTNLVGTIEKMQTNLVGTTEKMQTNLVDKLPILLL